MTEPADVRRMARYNRAVNEALYETLAELPDEIRRKEMGGHYGSIHGLLNHLLWGDLVWMHRFSGRPAPTVAFGMELIADFDLLHETRGDVDEEILVWSQGLSREQLTGDITWTSSVDGVTRTVSRAAAIQHLFNHQTHHRGQVTALLMILGHDYPMVDLPWIPEAIQE